jgi:putative hemolysin
MLAAQVTRDPALVRRAQELRFRVFANEPDVRGIDEDRFDEHCDHLVVLFPGSHRVVGTSRLLAPAAAALTGGYSAEEHFDLGALDSLRSRMVEAGRTCVDPGVRASHVLPLMAGALARYLLEHGHDYVFATAAVDVADGGHGAASICRAAEDASPSPVDTRVVPRRPLPLAHLRDTLAAPPPAVLRAYLALGRGSAASPPGELFERQLRRAACCCFRNRAHERALRAPVPRNALRKESAPRTAGRKGDEDA